MPSTSTFEMLVSKQLEKVTATWTELKRGFRTHSPQEPMSLLPSSSESRITPTPNKGTWKKVHPLSIHVRACHSFMAKIFPQLTLDLQTMRQIKMKAVMKPGTFQLGLILTQLRLSSKLETHDSFREVHNGLLLILHDSHVQYTNKYNYTHIYQSVPPKFSAWGRN